MQLKMDDEKKLMCNSLIEWFKNFNVPAPHSTVEELSDGVAFAQVLNQIAVETFPNSWLSKIVTSSNWRLKLSNLKKVIDGIYEYYTETLNFDLSEFPRPDAMKIVENCDNIETGKLLQLILGCAISCSKKQTYIIQIRQLEESLQQTIMKVLEDLESIWEKYTITKTPSATSINFATEKDSTVQKCEETEKRVALLLDENINLQNELSKLQNEINKQEFSLNRFNELKRNLEKLTEELLQSESAREDIKAISIQQEHEINILKQKVEYNAHSNTELLQLKDEVDVLREENTKLKLYEMQISKYKKKLEDFDGFKKQAKMFQDRNAEYLQQIAQFEEDSKKLTDLKGQIEFYKKEIKDLHSKLDAEMSKIVQLEFENKDLGNSITDLQKVNETLISERDSLREYIDEMKLNGTLPSDNCVSIEIQTNELMQIIDSLKTENKALREGQSGQTALAQLLNESNIRIEDLRQKLKTANERILLLTQSDKPIAYASYEPKINSRTNETFQTEINQLKQTISTKDQQISTFEKKYYKFVEKAKEIFKKIDPNFSLAIETFFEKSDEETPRMSEMEEQLIASAFYRFGVNAQTEILEAKLAKKLDQGGYSFLARHRELIQKKSQQP